MRGRALGRFLEDLMAGDAVALTLVGVIATIAILLGVFVLMIRRKLRLEDEERAKKYRRKK